MIILRPIPTATAGGEAMPRAAAQRCPFCRSDFSKSSIAGAISLLRGLHEVSRGFLTGQVRRQCSAALRAFAAEGGGGSTAGSSPSGVILLSSQVSARGRGGTCGLTRARLSGSCFCAGFGLTCLPVKRVEHPLDPIIVGLYGRIVQENRGMPAVHGEHPGECQADQERYLLLRLT